MGNILYPLEYAVAWIMVGWHSLLSGIGMDPASGWTWALSIVGLVIVIRIILIPLFVKQIKASRGMQLIAAADAGDPEEVQGQDRPGVPRGHDRETMALYRENGTNPFASCLPILLQSPIFFALFRVLNELRASERAPPIGPMTRSSPRQADERHDLRRPAVRDVHAGRRQLAHPDRQRSS